MSNKKLFTASLLVGIFCATSNAANSQPEDSFSQPFYFGVTGGYGATTWSYLVPSPSKDNFALQLSTPSSVQEGGVAWGFFGGYEFLPQFAIEGSFTRYPAATINFSEDSLYFYDNNRTSFTSTMTSLGLIGKFMVIIPRTTIRAYSGAGIAAVHRFDVLADHWRASPTFEVGFNYNWTPHWMVEIGGSYTGGFGEAELQPSEDYIPFLYSAFARLAYRF